MSTKQLKLTSIKIAQVSTSQSPTNPVKTVEHVNMVLVLDQTLHYSIELTITGIHYFISLRQGIIRICQILH